MAAPGRCRGDAFAISFGIRSLESVAAASPPLESLNRPKAAFQQNAGDKKAGHPAGRHDYSELSRNS
jgi:hypothetical protein